MPKNEENEKFDLFERHRDDLLRRTAPLADRMRPRTLEEFIGQSHIIGEGRLLRRAIQIDQLSSVIFYGPPGTGKTTLARIIANTTKAQFLSINAVLAGVKEIRESIEIAQRTLALYSKRTILFVDEVHRFNKSQQDALLPHVENGILILIGATTENPYFEVNKALVSRSRIFQLQILTAEDLKAVALQALSDSERGYGKKTVKIDDDALDHLVKVANGDARAVLNALELSVETTPLNADGFIVINRMIAEESIQQRAVLYDKDGDAHYDTISAFIKSIRGSDPDAALYWMSKMIYAGEDPRFIFRRMLILACEDIGMADPNALGIVMDAANAFDYVGMPEGRYHLAQACLYLSTAPKSNSSMAFFDAINVVTQENSDDVPNHLRDGNRDKDGFGHGANYLYPHAYRDHWVAQQYLPVSLQGKTFYNPSDQGYERQIGERVARFREAQLEAMIEADDSSPLFSPGENQSNEKGLWQERTLGSRSVQFGKIRERILSASKIKRGDLVLDLNARTGLLTFEASRQVQDGSVWALVYDKKAFSTLKTLADRIEPLSRPQFVLTDIGNFESELKKAAGSNVKFDVIMGRAVLSDKSDKKTVFLRILELLGKGGRLVIAENVSSEGQRLSDFLDMKQFHSSLVDKFYAVERELFSEVSNPMVNWTVESIKKEFENMGDFNISVQAIVEHPVRRLKNGDIEFWFRTEDGSAKKSFGSRLSEKCTPDEVDKIRRMLHVKLDNKEIAWKTVTMIVNALRGD